MNDEDNKINQEAEDGQKQNMDELEKIKAERDEYLNGWQRAKADFINYKKDEMRRMEEVAKYGQEELMRELITVMDNFELGLRALERNGSVDKGVYMIKAQMEDILKKYGLKKVEVKLGEQFDPNFAEAIAEVEAEGPPGSIAEEIEPGYLLNEKLIRPARVRITKSKTN